MSSTTERYLAQIKNKQETEARLVQAELERKALEKLTQEAYDLRNENDKVLIISKNSETLEEENNECNKKLVDFEKKFQLLSQNYNRLLEKYEIINSQLQEYSGLSSDDETLHIFDDWNS